MQTTEIAAFNPGDVIDIAGFPSHSESGVTFIDSIVRKASSAPDRLPPLVPAGKILAESRDSEFVRIEVLNPARSVDVEPLRAMVGAMERRLLNLEGLHDELARRIEYSRGTQPDDDIGVGKGREA